MFQQLGQDESLSFGTDSIHRQGGEMDVVAIGFQSLGTSSLGLTDQQEQQILDQVFSN